MKPIIEFSDLDKLLSYDALTGRFIWKVVVHRDSVIGEEAIGFASNGYRNIRINGISYPAHQLAWTLYHKQWPHHMIDHEDRNRSNNAIINLRAATPKQQLVNISKRSDNTSGYRGVFFDQRCKGKPWYAKIRDNGKQKYLGYYATPNEAAEAFDKEAALLWGDFYTPNIRQSTS